MVSHHKYPIVTPRMRILAAPFKTKRCQVCNKWCKKSLHLDHDHKTGMVRGWLCISCNVALGHVHDSLDILKKLISYLKRPPIAKY